jgi:hypothetical protein
MTVKRTVRRRASIHRITLADGKAGLRLRPGVHVLDTASQTRTAPTMSTAMVQASDAASSSPERRFEDFEVFYRGAVDRVYRALAAAIGDHHLAREATDEAMARAYARWSHVRDLSNPGGWVFRAGLNWATSRWRKLRRERPLADQVSVVDSDPAAAAAVEALAELPLPYRPLWCAGYCSSCPPWTPRRYWVSRKEPCGAG